MSRCKACEEPLVVHLDEGQGDILDDSPNEVPDDLELQCGCHFHWQCLMDEASSVSVSLRCPGCHSYLAVSEAGSSTTNSAQTPIGATILVNYTNEGGLQYNLDILPPITEEAYLQNNPEALPARALHVMCAEGDIEGVVELLRDVADQGMDIGSIVRYQDPLADMESGLHLAVQNMQEDVVWLLLWLSSALPTSSFPDPVRQAVESVGVDRLTVAAEDDIRNLQDSQHRTVEQLAQQLRGPWCVLLEAGIFSL